MMLSRKWSALQKFEVARDASQPPNDLTSDMRDLIQCICVSSRKQVVAVRKLVDSVRVPIFCFSKHYRRLEVVTFGLH